MSKTLKEMAIKGLHNAVTPNGFIASTSIKANYNRIWTRDGVLCGLAALSLHDKTLTETFKRTLITVFTNRHQNGFIPSNVDTLSGNISYGQAAGRIDAIAWAIIGSCLYLKEYPDGELKTFLREGIYNGFSLMNAFEMNGRHLMYVPLSGDWADEYDMHGYLLSDQLLRVWALELAADEFEEKEWTIKAELIRKVIESNYFKQEENSTSYSAVINHQCKILPATHWIAGFNPGKVYSRFDLLGNTLAIYLNLGTSEQQQNVIKHIERFLDETGNLIPSFLPVITEDMPEMEVLKNNTGFVFRNKPWEFHNGGVWPVWNGFLSACLKTKYRLVSQKIHRKLIAKLETDCDSDGRYNLNECFNGMTGNACGVANCSWTAAGFILSQKGFAHEN